jgi:DNA repair exonuclease SbcCD ATPase subunit
MPEPELHIAAELREAGERESLERESLETRVATLERELAQLRGREAGWREERHRLLSALAEAEREVAGLPALRAELEANRDAAYWLAVTRSSWSYRMGALARTAGRLLRRLSGRRPPA